MNLEKKKIIISKNKGITLIALIVTIVILIILATVSISVTFGENGLIAKAKRAGQDTESAMTNEQELVDKLGDETANIIASVGSGGADLPEIKPDTPAGTEIKKPEGETPEDKWSEKVTAISDGSGNAIPLPDGFYYVGGSRTDGLVISDNAADKNKGTSYETASTLVGNQFVWIPVDNEEAITRTNFASNGQPTAGEPGDEGLNMSDCSEPYEKGYSDENGTEEIRDFNTMKTQTLKYKGFYIARYEAGDSDTETTLRTAYTAAHTVVSKKGVAPYNWIPWGKSMSDESEIEGKSGAVYLAKNMYSSSESVTSTLCYGSQWDAMCRYIGDANRTITETKSEPEITGSVESDMSKNIYDIAGNCFEWTMEARDLYGGIRISRGGSYIAALTVSIRSSGGEPFGGYGGIAFRPTLYVKE